MISVEDFRAVVAESAARHRIPGISAAIMHRDEIQAAAWGVLNISTGVAVTHQSMFQVGSITKVFTGTLVMQLVDDGLVDLDAPIARYLPDLNVARGPIVASITVRTLLAHTSGIAGDSFVDTGRNDDATRRYVERCGELPYLHAPGRFSYCNSGYVLLGRLIEVISGRTWAEQLRIMVLEPLEMNALIDAERAVLFSTAAGHTLTATGSIQLTPTPYLPRSTEAAGSRLTMSAATLLKFARMHLRNGLSGDGTRVVSADSVRTMREEQVALPFAFHSNTGYGLAWALRGGSAPLGFGHNGATIGQSAFLVVFPEFDVAISALTNVSSGGPAKAFDEICHAVVAALGSHSWPAEPAVDQTIRPTAALCGRYETHMSAIDVELEGEELHVAVGARDQAIADTFGKLPDHHYVLKPIAPATFLSIDRVDDGRGVVGFTDFVEGVPTFVFWGGRLAKRMDASA